MSRGHGRSQIFSPADEAIAISASLTREIKVTKSAWRGACPTGPGQGRTSRPCYGRGRLREHLPRGTQEGLTEEVSRGRQRCWGGMGRPGLTPRRESAGAVRSCVCVGSSAAKAIFNLDVCKMGECRSAGLQKHFPGLCVYVSV